MNPEDGIPVTGSSANGRLQALTLFCGSLASLIFFNLLPGFGNERLGWTIWVKIIQFVQGPELFRHTKDLISIASLLTLLALVTASPFLIPVYLKSRLAWWLATLMAGISTSALWFNVISMVAPPRLGVGGWCLLAAPALNLAGLLVLRFAKRSN